MRNIILTSFLLLFFTACSTVNLSKGTIEQKDILIKKADNGNIQAMIKLSEHYKFPLTKEGLYYFNKWYKNIDKNDNKQDINNIAAIYYKYKDMFINGESRSLKLYELSSSLGNLDANITQINFLISSYDKEKIQKIENKILSLLNEEQLNQLYKAYENNYYSKNRATVINRMNEKGYKVPFHNTLEEIKKTIRDKSKNDLLNARINKVIEEKNSKNIYGLAHYLQTVYKQEDKALYTYKELLKIDPNNDKVYANIAAIYSKKSYTKNSKSSKELALKYYEKASLLGNKKASKRLLVLYSEESKNLDKFFALKKELIKTEKGQMALAEHYYTRKSYIQSNQIFEKLALNGNKEAILSLALTMGDTYTFNPDIYKTSKKWQEVIENINDITIEEKYINELLKYKYRKGYKEALSNYIQKNSKRINILTLRKLAKYNKYADQKKALYYYNIAKDAGDKKSIKELASFYLYSSTYKDFNKAVETYNILVEKGDIVTTNELASLYLNPPSYFKKHTNIKKGLEQYEYLAKKGNVSAIKELIEAYLCRPCYEKNILDYKKGFMYLKKLEYLDRGRDSIRIAWLYSTGKGVKKDVLKAKEYFEKAKKQGLQRANYYLASLYFKNKNSEFEPIYIDHKKALEYVKEGVKYRNVECINLLGVFYEKAYGVKKDIKKAVFYYKEAYNLSKSKSAAYNLGLIYHYGKGNIKKDFKLAKHWYSKSSLKEAKKQLALLPKNTK